MRIAAGALAYELRFDATITRPGVYLGFTGLLPLLWVAHSPWLAAMTRGSSGLARMSSAG